jgi:hypothetical protein
MQRTHDMGGMPAGRLDTAEHELTLFEQRVDAMLRLLADPPSSCFTVDALRRAIEDLPPAQYDALSYYERWVHAMRLLVVEKGLLTEAEIVHHLARQPRSPLGFSHHT